MEKKVISSPVDERDFKASKFLDYSGEMLPEYQAPATKVRCQWLSSQCVAYAVTQAMSQYDVSKTGNYKLYSPGLLYANREEDDFQGEGWYVRKALKQAYHYGTCLEEDFPIPEAYNTERNKFLKDKKNLLQKASKNKISAYFRCNNEDEIKRCIAQTGSCIVSSKTNGKFFWSGTITNETVKGAKGGHAYILVGWTKNGWIMQDSYSFLRPWFGRPIISFDFKFDEAWGLIK